MAASENDDVAGNGRLNRLLRSFRLSAFGDTPVDDPLPPASSSRNGALTWLSPSSSPSGVENPSNSCKPHHDPENSSSPTYHLRRRRRSTTIWRRASCRTTFRQEADAVLRDRSARRSFVSICLLLTPLSLHLLLAVTFALAVSPPQSLFAESTKPRRS